MTVEHKFISLAEFKAVTDGSGGFAGYMSRHGELDDGGDIVARGAHLDTIPQFLKHGFATNNHDWTFGNLYGYPVKAFEDEEGTFVEMRFHSTPDAQQARVKAQERMAAGLDVRLSIGYQPAVEPVIIQPKDYASEIPKYSKPGFEAANIQKAARFPFVRILLKNDLYEGALVSVPMLGSADVVTVKSGEVGDGLGTGLTYSAHLAWLGTAIKAFADRTDRVREMDAKEGRVFSQANWDELVALYERLGKLIEAGKPKPKEDNEESKQLIADVVLAIVRRDIALRGVPTR